MLRQLMKTTTNSLRLSQKLLGHCVPATQKTHSLLAIKTGCSNPRFSYKSVTPKLRTMKLDSPQFHGLFTPELEKLIELFNKYKYELRIAGGAVRDLLLEMQPHDVDFATTATPTEMKELFEKEGIRMINAKGESHGTITCRINDKENFEVTTLRIDVLTDGRRAKVEFTKDWQLDSLRRDLTVNSMFLGFDGTVYDYFNGAKDLEDRKLRFVGSAVTRIQEDFLRILRYFRFYGRISNVADDHEQETLDAIRDNMNGLAGISGERIWMELKKIMTGRYAGPLVTRMIDLGMAQYIGLPEKLNNKEFQRVWEDCHDLEPQPFTLVPALLETEEDVYKLNTRLKISRDELQLGVFIVHHRGDDFEGDAFRHCQNLLCDTPGPEGKTKSRVCELLKYRNQRDAFDKMRDYELPKFPVKGHRLIEKGIQKGPQFSRTLNFLRRKWKESRFMLTEEELLEFLDKQKK